MKTVLMENTEEEIELKRHLEGLEVDVSKGLEFWGHKHLVNVEDEDIFNQIAQLAKVKGIRDDGDLLFYIRHENTPWTIALKDRRQEFLTKYGNKYQII